MSLTLLLLIVLVVALIGGLPTWGYHSGGYWPSGLVGLLLVILIIAMLFKAI